MRLAVISDIHGNLRALEAVLARVRAFGDIDRLIVAGDLLSGPLEPSETADLLMSLQAAIIRGNHERQLLACAETRGGESDQFAFEHTTAAQQVWLATLPPTLELAADVLLCHGTPRTDLVYLCEELGAPVTLAPDATIIERLGGAAPGARALRPLASSAHRAPLHGPAGGQRRQRRSPGLPLRATSPPPRGERLAARAVRRLRADPARLASRAPPGCLRLGCGGRDRGATRSTGLGAVASLRPDLSDSRLGSTVFSTTVQLPSGSKVVIAAAMLAVFCPRSFW